MSAVVPYLFPGAGEIARSIMPYVKRRRVQRGRGRKRSAAVAFKPKLFRRTRPRLARRKRKGTKNVQGKHVSVKNIGRRLPKVLMPIAKGVANQKYCYNRADIRQSQTGRQAYFSYVMGTFDNAVGLGGDMPLEGNAEANDYLNIWNKVTGGDGALGAYSALRGTKVLIKNLQHTLYITNQTDGFASLTLYDCIPRRDTESGPVTALRDGNRVLQDNGPTTGNSAIAAFEPDNRLGCDPYGTPQFMSKWKIVNQRTIIMCPGQVHRHTLNFNCNKMMNTNLLEGDNFYLRGWSAVTMMKLHGFPGVSVANGDIASLISARLAVAYKKEITYSVPLQAVPRNHLIYNNITGGNLEGAFQVMNADGDIEVQDNA